MMPLGRDQRPCWSAVDPIDAPSRYPADRDGQPYLKETEYRVQHRVLNREYLVPHRFNRQPPTPNRRDVLCL